MAKPAITKRAVKAAALTYAELDTNFQNLTDATITITGGATQVTADLNGTITLVAGSNVTITGNNSTKQITIASTGGVTNPLSANLDLNGYTISDSVGRVSVNDSLGIGPDATTGINMRYVSGNPDSRIEFSGNGFIASHCPPAGSPSGAYITLFADGCGIGTGGNINSSISLSDPVRFGTFTTTERNTMTTPYNGMIIYNTTTDKFQGRAAGAWVDLH